MKFINLFALIFIFILLSFPIYATAEILKFVDDPSNNSTNWKDYLQQQNCVINTNIDFENHPIGVLNNKQYFESDGVSFTPNSGFNQIVNENATDGTTSTEPKSEGEGINVATKMLINSDSTSSLIVNFNEPISSFGIFLIDLYNPNNIHPYKIEVFDPNESSLGVITSAAYNFQLNYRYFMGIVSTANNISKVKISAKASTKKDGVLLDDIMFSRLPSNICSYIDSDKDGVIDQWDKCPGTNVGSWIDSSGCSGQNLYTEEQMNQMISKVLLWGDLNEDGKISLIEAIKALRITSGVTEPFVK